MDPGKEYEAFQKEKTSYTNATRTIAQNALKAPGLINGAAATIVVTIVSKDGHGYSELYSVVETFRLFIFGLFCSAFSLGFSYWTAFFGRNGLRSLEIAERFDAKSRYSLCENKFLKFEGGMAVLAIAFAIASYVCFGMGAWRLNDAFEAGARQRAAIESRQPAAATERASAPK